MNTTCIVQWVMACGTALAALGSCAAAAVAAVAAYLSWRSIRRQELRDLPRASVSSRFGRRLRRREIVVANVGHVPFTVMEVCVDGRRIEPPFAARPNADDDIPTVHPGGRAVFECGFDDDGPALVRLADGSAFEEGNPDADEHKDGGE